MNRDEQLARVHALPPTLRQIDGRSVLSPTEPSGGTWIAVNDSGITLALINWYAIKNRVKTAAISRGEVINAVIAACCLHSVTTELARLPLSNMNPFRLIGISPKTGEILEWQWDVERLACQKHPWKAMQWISSGFDEPQAQRIRSATFQQTMAQAWPGSLDWLRRLHRSHTPESGAFSTCMHRNEAETVSYTEVVLSSRNVTMRYQDGAPCRKKDSGLLKCSKVAISVN
jgi:hypothetical protein